MFIPCVCIWFCFAFVCGVGGEKGREFALAQAGLELIIFLFNCCNYRPITWCPPVWLSGRRVRRLETWVVSYSPHQLLTLCVSKDCLKLRIPLPQPLMCQHCICVLTSLVYIVLNSESLMYAKQILPAKIYLQSSMCGFDVPFF